MSGEYGRITGIADEGGAGIESQLELHASLGWPTIELRTVDGQNICEMNDRSFERVYAKIVDSGITPICFGSAIANWARSVTTPFSWDVEDLKRAIPRMRRLGTRFIRIMSYPNGGLNAVQWERLAFDRMESLVEMAESEGIVLLLENCDGWASQTPLQFARMLSELDSPALRAVFDTGNPVSHGGTPASTWKFYQAARPYIDHFHVKDCRVLSDGTVEHVMPGEGDCKVAVIIKDLLSTGYSGLFSIEPHIAAQIHLAGQVADESEKRGVYLSYGRRMNQMWDALVGEELVGTRSL